MYDLQKFVIAQTEDYEIAKKELKEGRKKSHWMWYIFPQIAGLGKSGISMKYALSGIDETKKYYNHELLGKRLKELTTIVLESPVKRADIMFGYLDVMKLKSCMTLFYVATGDEIFKAVLDKYYGGQLDYVTLNILSLSCDPSKFRCSDFEIINHCVMRHTNHMCHKNDTLFSLIQASIEDQYMVYEYETVDFKFDNRPTTNIFISDKRTLTASRAYKDKHVAVLNFANNHSIGGAPYSAGGQEESLCRCSTLYQCLLYSENEFYKYHQELYDSGIIDELGNDDLLYTPFAVVFKDDTDKPALLAEKDWCQINVISSSAPELRHYKTIDEERLYKILYSRLEKVLQVAQANRVKVLILGAYGCGASHNPPEVVAKVFKALLEKYYFEQVEFAIFCRDEEKHNYNVFKKVFGK